jgi:hypothetical protein
MKRLFLVCIAVMVIGLFSGLAISQEQEGSPETPPKPQQEIQKPGPEGEWMCPWCGRKAHMGSGMTKTHEGGPMKHGMMQGKMHEGGQMGHGMMHQGKEKYRSHMKGKGHMRPTNKNEVKMLLNHYVSGNPNLKVGKITEKDEAFVANIVTRDNSMVEKVIVDKKTGWMKKEY